MQAPVPPPPLPPGNPQLPLANALAAPKHKFSGFLDQADETEFQEADMQQVQRWHQDFIADAQVKPPRQERASALQLSAMHHKVVTLRRSPRVQLSLWS